MAIFGMTGAEIRMLERWADMVGVMRAPCSKDRPFHDIYHLRCVWMRSGGKMPVTEAEVYFLKPVSNG